MNASSQEVVEVCYGQYNTISLAFVVVAVWVSVVLGKLKK